MSSAQTPGAARPLPAGPTIVLAAAVATLVVVVIAPFVVPVLWALLLAYVTWPLYRWLTRRWRHRAGFAAFALTIGVAAAIIAPMIAKPLILFAANSTCRDGLVNASAARTGYTAVRLSIRSAQ